MQIPLTSHSLRDFLSTFRHLHVTLQHHLSDIRPLDGERLHQEFAYNVLFRGIILRVYEDRTGNRLISPTLNQLRQKKVSINSFFEVIDNNFARITLHLSHDKQNSHLHHSPSRISEELLKSCNPTVISSIASVINSCISFLLSYSFQTKEVDVLGQIHQVHIGRETRKRFGQYYTPHLLREYMVCTLPWKELLHGEIRTEPKLILDPACGSGGFLMEIYHYLQENPSSLCRSLKSKDYHEYLVQRLWGVDIDESALELARLNLMFQSHLTLPSLPFSNFTIPTHLYHLDAIQSPLNPSSSVLSSLKHKCALVIGNPPFHNIKKFPHFDQIYPELQSVSKPNIASLFLVRYSKLLAPGGLLAYVFPASLLFSETFFEIRRYLVNNYRIQRIVQLGKVFSDVGLEQIILIIQNLPPSEDHLVDVVYGLQSTKDLSNKIYRQTTVRQSIFQEDPHYRFLIYRSPPVDVMLQRIHEHCKPFMNFVETYSSQSNLCIFRGLGLEKWSFASSTSSSSHFPSSQVPSDSTIPDSCTAILKGNDLIRYGTKSTHCIDKKYLKSTTPKMQAMILRDKIILQRLVSSRTRIVATLVGKDVVSLSTVENIILKSQYTNISKSEEYKDFIYYLLALLNSDFMTYYIIDHVFIRCKLSTSLDRQYLENLPIWLPSPAEISEVASLTREMLSLVAQQISSGNKLEQNEQNEQNEKIEKIEKFEKDPKYLVLNAKINEKIASIYELSSDERNLINGRIQEFYGIQISRN